MHIKYVYVMPIFIYRIHYWEYKYKSNSVFAKYRVDSIHSLALTLICTIENTISDFAIVR